MNGNGRFSSNHKRGNPGHGRNLSARLGKPGRSRRAGRSGFGLTWAWAVVAIMAAGIYAADRYHAGDGLALAFTAPKADTVRATFSYCTEGHRVTCVVDGDTFRLSGERIRIADIDAPEINPPRCEAERVKGEAAKRRLRELLNAGPFSLVAGMRDEDRYGRKLRTVMRDGRSIGDMLVEDGLARRWDGARRSWCD